MKALHSLPIILAAAACTNAGTGSNTGILDFNPAEDVIPILNEARTPRTVWGADAPRPAVTLLTFSDLHGDRENLERIVEFKEAYSDLVEDAIHLGDGVYCYWDNPNEWDNVPGARSVMNVVGNHDCWKSHLVWAETDKPYDASEEDVYQTLLTGADKESPYVKSWHVVQPEGVGDPESPYCHACYYYKDYEESGMRLIVLDGIHYTEAQDSWFAKVLDEARAAGLAVIACTHYPAANGLDGLDTGFNSRTEGIPVVADQTVVQFEAMPDQAFVTADAFIDEGGCLVCWLAGHHHSDYMGLVRGHERQLMIVHDKAGERDDYMAEDRARGTRNQDSFNLVTFNPSKSLLIVNRIGCTRSEDLRSKKLFVWDYLKREMVATE